MANTVYGPYATTAWADGSTPLNQTHLNNLETQASVAIHSLNNDFSGPFVHSGMVCSRNGGNLQQLDVTTGIAYAVMPDLTIAKIATVASTTNQFLTATPTTTYYLFLKSDGTWQWGTSSVGGGALPIAQATTDGSSNILAVTDVRHTAGSPGQAYQVFSLRNQHVTATSIVQTNWTVPITGLYVAHGCMTLNNSASGNAILFDVVYTEGRTGNTNQGVWFVVQNGGGTYTGGVSSLLNGSYSLTTGVFCAQGGSTAVIKFRDPTNTPNDWYDLIIQRIG